MKLIKKIRSAAGDYSFKKVLRSVIRERKSLNFSTARSVLILFDIDTNEELNIIKKYISFIKESGKKVKAIGFYDSPKPFQLSYSKVDFEILNRKDINWYLKPSDPFLDSVASEPYDILINISIRNFFPLKYIAGLSKAKCKIGPYSKENEFIYDLMIDIDGNKELKYFLKQVDHYLKLINNPSHE